MKATHQTPAVPDRAATPQRQADAHPLNSSPRMVSQRARIAAAFGPVAQRREGLEDEQPLQARAAPEIAGGLPGGLRAGIESLSGLDMSGVRVHRNSAQPAQLNALAYAQGNDIHLAPGQEQHLPHEAWHVVQQAQGRVPATRQLKAGVDINDDAALEAEADAMGHKALQAQHEIPVQMAGAARLPVAGAAVQRRVGLELEVAVPMDELTGPQATALQNHVTGIHPGLPTPLQIQQGQALADAGRIGTYQGAIPGVAGFHVDSDHDDRVQSPQGTWPPREAADGILEIVMDAVETQGELDTTMANIQVWINTLMANTNNLTTHWAVAGTAFGVGPLHFPAVYGPAGIPAVRQANHNFRGSIQANVGVDLREFHSMMKWYARSSYAPRSRATDTPVIRNQKADMLAAVGVGKRAVDHIRNVGFMPATPPLTAAAMQSMGNLRGLRGWLTHTALALIRGAYVFGIQGSSKNIVPVLLKSANDLVVQHGLTAAELLYYTTNRAAIVAHVLAATNRLANDGMFADTAFKIGGAGNHPVWSIPDLFDETLQDAALIAPANQKDPSDVGPARTGNADVQAITDAPVMAGLGGGPGRRAGMVLEFRTIEGLHNGVNAWKSVAKAFLKAADKRNTRGGLSP